MPLSKDGDDFVGRRIDDEPIHDQWWNAALLGSNLCMSRQSHFCFHFPESFEAAEFLRSIAKSGK